MEWLIRELMRKKAALSLAVNIMQDLITGDNSKLKPVWPL